MAACCRPSTGKAPATSPKKDDAEDRAAKWWFSMPSQNYGKHGTSSAATKVATEQAAIHVRLGP